MEAVAEAVMDKQVILLGSKTNVEHKGTLQFWILAFFCFCCCCCFCFPFVMFSEETVNVHLMILEILCVQPAVLKLIVVTDKDSL